MQRRGSMPALVSRPGSAVPHLVLDANDRHRRNPAAFDEADVTSAMVREFDADRARESLDQCNGLMVRSALNEDHVSAWRNAVFRDLAGLPSTDETGSGR